MSINESQFRDMLDRYLNGTATPEEVRLLDNFFERHEHGSHLNVGATPELKEEILSQIQMRITPPRARFTFWKIAASFLLIAVAVVGLRFWMINDVINNQPVALVTEQTPLGQKSQIELPDGSIVHLNAGTQISYPKTFSQQREVSLDGEAFFDVVHDDAHPFVVKFKSSSVKVLGTTFNINTEGQAQPVVTLVSGKVNVSSAEANTTLTPSHQALVDESAGVITTREVDVRKYVSWKDNIIFFDQTPVSQAVVILERWYDTKVILKSNTLRTCTITGQYKEESLENVMKSFEFLFHADVDFSDPKQVVITGGTCKGTN